VDEIAFTPTLVLPPQGGGDKRRDNPAIKGEETREVYSCLKGTI